MTSKNDPLSQALEELRHRPIVSESRDYARHWEQSSGRAHRARTAALYFVGALAAIGIAALLTFPRLSGSIGAYERGVYRTAVGELRTVRLEDGSRVMLDTSSRIRVNFSATGRDVALLEGQAHFEVAKNPARPFRVRTTFAEVVAVGTSFDVAAQPSRTTVTLIEGRVNVRTVVNGAGADNAPESLTPGQQLAISDDGHILAKKPVQIATATSWQRGTIVLDDVPLSEALATLNRYSATKIVIESDELHSRRVSGVFVIGDVETEALVLRKFLGLSERSRSEERIVLGDGSGDPTAP